MGRTCDICERELKPSDPHGSRCAACDNLFETASEPTQALVYAIRTGTIRLVRKILREEFAKLATEKETKEGKEADDCR